MKAAERMKGGTHLFVTADPAEFEMLTHEVEGYVTFFDRFTSIYTRS